DKPEIVALSKIDALSPELLKQQKERLQRAAKKKPLLLSAQSGAGVPEALRTLLSMVEDARGALEAAKPQEPWRP
ncbi:MAG: GTPase ObgE, partial [Azorhizobium sp. 12-66-6]